MPPRKIVRKVVGYGARLAEAMRRSGLTQEMLAEKTSISRQTLAKALNADELSARTERQIAAALEESKASVTRFQKRPTSSIELADDRAKESLSSHGLRDRQAVPIYVDATELARWAERRSAQSELPRLVRRLILSSGKPSEIAMRAGEGVQLPDWDGIVIARGGHAFVPEGQSAWEIGTSKEVKAKADEDYRKRSAEPGDIDPRNTTFVFATSRRWPEKRAWMKAKRAEKLWFDVRAYDADDLEAWLEQAPAVHLWISGLLGAPVDGASDLHTQWEQWSRATVPPIDEAFILAGREEVSAAIVSWLEHPQTPLVIRAESREEAIAVFASSVVAKLPRTALAEMVRALVVYDAVTWRRLMVLQEPKILIAMFDGGDLIAAASRQGHLVVVPVSHDEPQLWENGIDVPAIDVRVAIPALLAGGVTEDRASEYASLARRSVIALRRQTATARLARIPTWAQPAEGRKVLPALLAGRWSEKFPGDREVVETFGRAPYDELRDRLVGWTERADPPIRRRDSMWFLVSIKDSWQLLSRYLLEDDLKRFENVAVDVLSEVDPRYDLPIEKRWMANVLGEAPRYSGLLRQGIANTLAMMGTGGADPSHANETLTQLSARVVEKIFARADANWRLWASLGGVLSTLAEAAPDQFLDAVESGLATDTPLLAGVFLDQDGGFFATSPHVHLLWALERLAWSPLYLARVARILVRLSAIDPGAKSNNGNRPSASLRSFFRPWLPQTVASVEQRNRVINAVQRQFPEAAWQLILSILPRYGGFALYNPRPDWREWVPQAPTQVSHADYRHAIDSAVQQLAEMAGMLGDRWSQIIDALPHLDNGNRDLLLGKLAERAAEFDESARTLVWNAARSLVSKHRSHPDAKWVMPTDTIDAIDSIRAQLEPTDGIQQFGWLFTSHPSLPEGRPAKSGHFDEYHDEVRTRRATAVEVLYAKGGVELLLRLAEAVKVPELVGQALARLVSFHSSENDFLLTYLASPEHAHAAFAFGFANARIQEEGLTWVENKIGDTNLALSTKQRIELLRLLPAQSAAWHLAEGEGSDVEVGYWNIVYPYVFEGIDPTVPVRKLLERGRVFAAIELLSHLNQPDDYAGLILDVLEALVNGQVSDQSYDSFSYDAGNLLDALESAKIDDARLTRLEWALLPIVDEHQRYPMALHRALANEPSFFVEAISQVFRSDQENEVVEITEEGREKANRAYTLLHSWRHLPGQHDNGAVDSTELLDWVRTARQSLAEAHRLSIGDEMIGQMLSGGQRAPDGAWPAVAVRDVIEEIESEDLDRGVAIGAYNQRGVVMRPFGEGGMQERSIAEGYDGYSAIVADRWPRTAAILRDIASTYRNDAKREDQRLALHDDLGEA